MAGTQDTERSPREQALAHFQAMVESVGVKRFATSLGVTTRQVNRILAGVQPNPVYRLQRCLQACPPEVGDRVLDFLCSETGGHFVREEGTLDRAAVNAVKECAEAIAAISDGEVSDLAELEIREAIAALMALNRRFREGKAGPSKG